MTVNLDVELQGLLKHFQLSNSQAMSNTDNNISENNENAVNSNDLDYKEIIESLELNKTENRYAVMSQLSPDELVKMLYLLDKDNLTLGLKFFTKEKLMSFILSLPKNDLMQIIFQIFTQEELLAMMPVKELDKLLSSDKIDKNQIYKLMQSLPTQMLAQIYESATGKQAGNISNDQLLAKIGGLKQQQLVDGLTSLSYKQKLDFIGDLTKADPKLFQEFSTTNLMKSIEISTKSELVESMIVLEPDQLINMLSYLPENLLSQVATLIDPDKFAYVLENYFTNLLANLAG